MVTTKITQTATTETDLMPQTPNWIQPADEVASTARGLALGMQMGSEQAAQRFQEQQMMRKEQEDAMAKAQWEAEYGMKAAEVARKHTAMQEYQQRIAAGEDPLKVILEVGPKIGIGGAAEAAAIHAQNQKKPPTWSMIPGLPEGVHALQSSAGGIHVVPTPRPQAKWQDTTKSGLAGQMEVNSGRFQAFPNDPAAALELRKDALAKSYAKEVDDLVDKFGHTGDLVGDGGSKAQNDTMKAQFKYAKSRVDELKAKIAALDSGSPSHSGAAAPSSPFKISNIRPAGQNAPHGTLPAGPPPIAPPWPADEGMGAPPIPAPPQAPMEMARPPMAAPPMAAPPQPLQGGFEPRTWNTDAERQSIEGTNRNFIPKMTDEQLVDTAHKLGLETSAYDKQDDKFRVWREGQGARQQKRLSRKEFEEAVIKLANDKQMAWRGQ